MINLFSNFDIYFFSLTWMILILILIIFYNPIFKIKSLSFFTKKFFSFFTIFFLSLKEENFNKNFIIFILSIVIILFYLNFSSIIPFIFPSTSNLNMVIFCSLNIWTGLIIFQLINSNKRFLSHCIPEGTPLYLTWFLFLIEIVRNFIRPITLTVRLLANILAGHLLIILLSKLVFLTFSTFMFYLTLNAVEIIVALIQSYIFSTIIALYYSELR